MNFIPIHFLISGKKNHVTYTFISSRINLSLSATLLRGINKIIYRFIKVKKIYHNNTYRENIEKSGKQIKITKRRIL